MAKPSPSARKARTLHRYLGFFLAGIMAVYALSGIVLIYRKTDTFKVVHHTKKTLATNLTLQEVGKAMNLKNLKAERTVGEVIHFTNGTYNPTTGAVSHTTKKLPFLLNKMTHLHKATTKDPLYFLNVFFGLSLLFFVITAFWMYLPAGPILKKGLWFTAGGIALTLLLLFL